MSNAPTMSSEEQGRVLGSGGPTSERTLDLGPRGAWSLEERQKLSKPGGQGGSSVAPGAPGEPEQGAGGPRGPGECQGLQETREVGPGGGSVVPRAPGEPEQRCRGSQRTQGRCPGGSWGNQGRWGWGGGGSRGT